MIPTVGFLLGTVSKPLSAWLLRTPSVAMTRILAWVDPGRLSAFNIVEVPLRLVRTGRQLAPLSVLYITT